MAHLIIPCRAVRYFLDKNSTGVRWLLPFGCQHEVKLVNDYIETEMLFSSLAASKIVDTTTLDSASVKTKIFPLQCYDFFRRHMQTLQLINV